MNNLNNSQFIFCQFVTVYPVSLFATSQHNQIMSQIDATQYPDGYITNDPTFQGLAYNFTSESLMGVTLINLPLAAAVTIDIYQLDEVLSNLKKFLILNGKQIFNLHNQYSRNQPLKLSGSHAISFLYQTEDGCDLQDEIIHMRYSGIYNWIFNFV